jgi:hypothetical protein
MLTVQSGRLLGATAVNSGNSISERSMPPNAEYSRV